MSKSRLATLIGSAALWAVILPVHLSYAQEGDGLGLSQTQTQRAVNIMSAGFETCASVGVPYRMDCYQQVFGSGAKVLDNNAGYWEAEVALTRVSRNLFSFVRSNTDSNLGRIREGGFRMKAITEASLPEASKVYRENLQRASDLMRSGSTTEQRYFEPIAELVEAQLGAMPK